MELDLDQVRKDLASFWKRPVTRDWLNGPSQDATDMARLLKAVPPLVVRIEELQQALFDCTMGSELLRKPRS